MSNITLSGRRKPIYIYDDKNIELVTMVPALYNEFNTKSNISFFKDVFLHCRESRSLPSSGKLATSRVSLPSCVRG